MSTRTRLFLTVAIGLPLSSSASATLIDRGNGMIYDSDQDITWLQDANYAMTSGYDADGRMGWAEAKTWADNLVFGGYDDWRLASVIDDNDNGCMKDDGSYVRYNGSDCGYNVDTSDSELAYMWYDILGNTPYADTNGNYPQAGWGLTSTSADGVDILNLESNRYWSGTEYAPNSSFAWFFDTDTGNQGSTNENFDFFAWAVRSGDIDAVSVPEPSTLLLLATGMVGVAGARQRRC